MALLSGLPFLIVFFPCVFLKSSIQDESVFTVQDALAFQSSEPASPDLPIPASPVGRPVRLKIPKIKVNAPVKYVGLTAQGAMDVPKRPSDVAWFKLGPPPGEIGSSVIAGHYGWTNNTPAVFDNLHKLRKGDKIYIEDEKGESIVFVVRKIQTYGKNENASGVFISKDGKAHLNLITCTGIWNKKQRSYSNRLIVFTERE